MCERHIDWLPLTHPKPGTRPATQACALTGNQTTDPLVCGPVLNPLSHTCQGEIFNIATLFYKFLLEKHTIQIFLYHLFITLHPCFLTMTLFNLKALRSGTTIVWEAFWKTPVAGRAGRGGDTLPREGRCCVSDAGRG